VLVSYELRIWDPARHPPLPASSDDAVDLVERLLTTPDGTNPAFARLAQSLSEPWETTRAGATDDLTIEAFWGADPREAARSCQLAVYQLSLPDEDAQRLALAVSAATRSGLALLDDENGMCFLPDGTVYPEDMREMWASTLDDLRGGRSGAERAGPDSRTLLQRIAGELFDAIGRGNNH
jgi:hypothetical protein